MARRINILKAPFDYHWPGRQAVTHFSATGKFLVKDEVAEFAIAKGYAIPDEPAKPATTRRRAPAKTANTRRTKGVAAADLPDAGRTAHGRAVDHDAG